MGLVTHEGTYANGAQRRHEQCSEQVVVSAGTTEKSADENISAHHWKARCMSLCLHLRELVTRTYEDTIETFSGISSSTQHIGNRCTVGVMLLGLKVENVLVGGPAYGRLQKGDMILKIDGISITEENVLGYLRGNDVPGTHMLVTVKRSKRAFDSMENSASVEASQEDSISKDFDILHLGLTRISTAEIADRRRMFDLFTFFEGRVIANQDSEGFSKLNETIDLWTKMCISDTEKCEKIKCQLREMQTKSQDCLAEVMDCVDRIVVALTSNLDKILDESAQNLAAAKGSFHCGLEEVSARVESLEFVCSQLSDECCQQGSAYRNQYITFQNHLESSLLAAQQKQDDADARIEELSNQSEQLQKQMKDRDEMLKDLLQCLDDAKTENEMISSKVQGMITRSELIAAQAVIEEQRHELFERSCTILAINARAEALEQQLRHERERNFRVREVLPKMLDDLASICVVALSCHQHLADAYDIWLQRRDSLCPRSELHELEGLLDSMRLRLQKEAEDYELRLDNLQSQIDFMRHENSNLLTVHKAMSAHIVVLESRLKRVDMYMDASARQIFEVRVSVLHDVNLLAAKLEEVQQNALQIASQCEIHSQRSEAQQLHNQLLLAALDGMVPRYLLQQCQERLAGREDDYRTLALQMDALLGDLAGCKLRQQEMVSRSELVAALDEISAQKTAALEVEAELIELEGRWLRTENLLIEVMGCTAALNGKIGCIVMQFRQEQVAIKRNAAEAISKLNHEALLRENEMAEYQRLQEIKANTELMVVRKQCSQASELCWKISRDARLGIEDSKNFLREQVNQLLSTVNSFAIKMSALETECLRVGAEFHTYVKEHERKSEIINQKSSKMHDTWLYLFSERSVRDIKSQIWKEWTDLSLYNRTVKLQEQRVLQELGIRKIKKVFLTLQDNLCFQKFLRNTEFRVCRQIKFRLGQCVLLHWKNYMICEANNARRTNHRIILRSYRKWNIAVYEIGKLKSVSSNFMYLQRKSTLTVAISDWFVIAAAQRGRRSTCKVLTSKRRMKSLKCTFVSWKENARHKRKLKRSAARIWMQSKFSSLAHAWNLWYTTYDKSCRNRQVCGKIIFRWQSLLAVYALQGWKSRSDDKLRLKRLCSMATRNGECLVLKNILIAWVLKYLDSRRLTEIQRSIRRKWGRITHKNLLIQWQSRACLLSRLRFVLAGYSSRNRRNLQHCVLSYWRATGEKLKHSLQKTCAKVNRVTRRVLLIVIVEWRSYVWTREHKKSFNLKTFAKFSNRVLCEFLRCWHAFVCNQRTRLRLCQRMCMRSQVRLASDLLNTWKHHVSTSVSAAIERTNRYQKIFLRTTVKRWLLSWRRRDFLSHRVKASTGLCYAKLCKNILSYWQAWTKNLMWSKRAQGNFKLHKQILEIRSCFRSWVESCRILRRWRHKSYLGDLSSRKLSRRAQKESYCLWIQFVQARKVQRIRTDKFVQQGRQATLASVFREWQLSTFTVKRRQHRIRSINSCNERILVQSALTLWWDSACIAHHDRYIDLRRSFAEKKPHSFAKHRLIRSVCRAWALYTGNRFFEIYQDALMQQVALHLQKKSQINTKSLLINSWRSVSQYHRWKKYIVAESMTRASRAAVSFCLESWKIQLAQTERVQAAHRVISCA